jgi:imidazole glycerol-phosphate synthase subunit HisF
VLQPRLIPILLLKDGRLQKSTRFGNWRYVGDARNAVSIFNDKCVDELVLFDVDAHNSGVGPNMQMLETIAREAFVPLTYGGGVKSLQVAEKLVSFGFDRIAINSAFRNDPNLLKSISSSIGQSSASVSIDVVNRDGTWLCRSAATGQSKNRVGGEVYHDDLKDSLLRAQDLGAGEVILQNASRDGTKLGLDQSLTEFALEHLEIPLVIGGGYASFEDASQAWSLGASGVAAGAAFCFVGKNDAVLLNYPNRPSGVWVP